MESKTNMKRQLAIIKKYQKKKKSTRLFKRCETPKHTSNDTFASNRKGNGTNLENPQSIICDCSPMA